MKQDGLKRRYYTLDALRGVAAIAVFAHHGNGLAAPLGNMAGYRAVDLFFVLSGFVLAHSYEDRLAAGYGVYRFMLDRLVRLYPLYLLSALAGACGFWITYALGGNTWGPSVLVPATVALLMFLPSPTWRSTGDLAPLNVPCWSLYMELLANMVFALIARSLSNLKLAIIVAFCAIWLISMSLANGNANLGADWLTVAGGVARVGFTFFAGVLVYRLLPNQVIVTYWACLIPISSLLIFYFLSLNLIADLVSAFVIIPLLIASGAILEIPEKKISSLLGDISYGLYVLHVPAILLIYRVFSFFDDDANRFAPAIGTLLLIFLIFLVAAADRWYDRPLRRDLRQRIDRQYLSKARSLS